MKIILAVSKEFYILSQMCLCFHKWHVFQYLEKSWKHDSSEAILRNIFASAEFCISIEVSFFDRICDSIHFTNNRSFLKYKIVLFCKYIFFLYGNKSRSN